MIIVCAFAIGLSALSPNPSPSLSFVSNGSRGKSSKVFFTPSPSISGSNVSIMPSQSRSEAVILLS